MINRRGTDLEIVIKSIYLVQPSLWMSFEIYVKEIIYYGTEERRNN